MARHSSKHTNAENGNQRRTHRLAPDGEVAEDYVTGRRSNVPNSSAKISKRTRSVPLCTPCPLWLNRGSSAYSESSVVKSLPVVARLLRCLLVVGPVALLVRQNRDPHRHKHRRHDQHQNPRPKPLNHAMARGRSLRIAQRATLRVAGCIRRQNKSTGQRDTNSPQTHDSSPFIL